MKFFAATVILRGLGALSHLLFTLVIARFANTQVSGYFFFVYAILFISATAARMGSELSGMRKAAGYVSQEMHNRIDILVISRAFLTTIVSTLIIAAIVSPVNHLVSSKFLESSESSATTFLLFSIIPMSLLGLFSEILKGIGKPGLGIAFQNILVPLSSSGALILILANAVPLTFTNISLIFLVSSTLSSILAIISFAVWRKKWSISRVRSADEHIQGFIKNCFAEVHSIIRDSPNLTVVTTSSVTMQWIGSVILGVLATPASVTGYSVSIRLTVIVSTINSAVVSHFAPRTGAAHFRKNLSTVRKNTQSSGMWIAGLCTPFLAVLFTYPDFILDFFGENLNEFSTTLRILTVGQVAAAFIGHSGITLIMTGQYLHGQISSLIAIGVLAGLMVSLIPLYQSEGAAIAMSVAVISGHFYAYIILFQKLNFSAFPLNSKDLKSTIFTGSHGSS